MTSSAANINSDLLKERKNAQFDVEQLTFLLYGGPEKTRRRRFLQNIAIQDPVIKSCKPYVFCSREEQYEESMKKYLRIIELCRELGITNDVDKFYLTETAAASESSPVGLHTGMFIPTLEMQCSDEQKKKYLQKAKDYEIVGTYAQTELGHGTFIRGLETTATYDPKTKEFVCNTPTLTSMKYWPGNLGKSTNYCVLMAQLYTNGKCEGLHTFLMPLRDLKTHEVLPGIELGDIGPKFGYGSNDNGYMRLNNVRIPRENLLSKYSKVLEDGTYVKPLNTRLSYGSMVLIRTFIVTQSSRALAKSSVIAIRYSAVRRQTEESPGGPEPQVLDYQTQQQKLFPILAAAYAFFFAGQEVLNVYIGVREEVAKNNLEKLPELHALSAGLKAFSSYAAAAGVEVCRMCCGGHGYSQASGLPKIYVDITPACTYEGENTVMYLQTARYLVKSFAKIKKGVQLPGFVAYLASPSQSQSCMTAEVALNCLVLAYEHRARRLVTAAATYMQKQIEAGVTPSKAWNMASVQLTWASRAHSHAYCVKSFVETVTKRPMDSKVRAVLTALCKLYAVSGIIENLGEFIQDKFFNEEQVNILTNKMMELLAELRPNAVALVDAFDYPDKTLDSCLGRYDGQVYSALYEYAKSSPFNKSDITDAYKKYLKPFMEGKSKVAAPAHL